MGGFERRSSPASELALDEEPLDRRHPDWRPAAGKVTRTMRLAHDFAAARLRRDAVSDAPLDTDPTTGLMPELTRGGGRRMPTHIEEALGAALGRDLSGVRIHDDANADAAARAINARAFALGDDLFFAANQYDPDSSSGLRLLAHEVAHTAQDHGSGAVEISRPHDADERAADDFADHFVARRATEPSKLYGPADFPMIRTVTPTPIARSAAGGKVRRWSWGWGTGGPTFASDPITIFDKKSKSKTFDLVKPTYVPLISGMVVVEGLPVTYRAGAEASVTAGADAWAGPARMSGITVTPSAAQVKGRNEAFDNGAVVGGPLGGVAARKYYDIINSPYNANGTLHFDAGVSAHLDATAGFSAEVAAADMLAVGGFARLSGGARGKSSVALDGVMNFDWWALGHAALNTSLTASWDTTITFDLAAEAGIFVELRPPKIPLLDDLYGAVRKIPGLSYVMPEFTALKWRREWKRRFPIYSKTQQWFLSREISIHGHTLHGVTVSGDPETTDLLNAAQKGISAATQQTPEEDIPKEDKDTRPKPDVSSQRAAAHAQVKSTKRTVAREKKWNKEMLDVARQQAAAKAKAASASGSGPAPSLAIPAGAKDPITQLDERDKALGNADGAADDLEHQIAPLQKEEHHENSEHRRAAGAGYDAIARSADKVGDAVDKGEGVFEKPLLSDDKESEKKFNALISEYMQRLDPLYDIVTTEVDWGREILEETSGIAEVGGFREKVVTRHNTARKASYDLERIGPTIDLHRKQGLRGDYAGALAKLEGMRHEIESLEGKTESLKTGRPEIPWDVDHVLPESGQLMLLHPYRKGTTVREKFYGDYYDAQTRKTMDASLHRIKDTNGEEYWYYPDAKSGNAGKPFAPGVLRPGETGDDYWLLYHDKQMPTRAHNHPPVVQHWNSTGRAMGQAGRVAFYNGKGPGNQPLTWEPKSINSSKSGGKNPDGSPARYKFDVSVKFRGT